MARTLGWCVLLVLAAARPAHAQSRLQTEAIAANELERALVSGQVPDGEAAESRRRLQALAAGLHALTVRVPIDGAEILVDGRAVARTPLDGRLFVVPGPHRIEARLAGQTGDPVDVTATAGGASTVALELRPSGEAVTILHVETVPRGLAVEIDGAYAGDSPVRAEVSPGTHSVRVERPGWRREERTIRVPVGRTRSVRIDYAGVVQPARLRIVRTRTGTTAAVDDERPQLLGPEGRELLLDPGSHSVRVGGTDGGGVADNVELRPGDEVLLRVGHGEGSRGIPPAAFWATLATAGAFAVGAAVTGLLALSEQSDFDDRADRIQSGDYRTPAELAELQAGARDAKDRGEGLATASDVLWITAGAAAVVSAGMLLLGVGNPGGGQFEVVRGEAAR